MLCLVTPQKDFRLKLIKPFRCRLFLLVSCGLAPQLLLAQAQKDILATDLYAFQWIGDTQVSPDGSRLAFVKATVSARHDGYETSLWELDLTAPGAPFRLTAGLHDTAPRWSPDGRRLAFVRTFEIDGKRVPQIFVLPLSGGEALRMTNMPHGASHPFWSPDGTHLAFLTGATPDEWNKQQSAQPGEAVKDESTSDVRVIARATYRENSEGYLDFEHPAHIWVIDLPSSNPEKLPAAREITWGHRATEEPVWAADSSGFYYFCETSDEPELAPERRELFSAALRGVEPVTLTSVTLAPEGVTLSPDGKQLAFTAEQKARERSYSEPDLFTLALEPGAQPKNLTADYDYDIGAAIGGDSRAPRGDGRKVPTWLDPHTILEVSTHEGRAELVKIDATTGAVTEWTHGQHAVQLYGASKDGSRVVALVSTPVQIGDLYSVSAAGELNRLSDVNHDLFARLHLAEPVEIWYKSFDGRKIQAWVQRPPDFDESKKYPLILNIHGGPHAAYGWVFDHEFQFMAAKGYVVLYPNPRGSTSYGQEFGNVIQYRYPGDDFKDLMAGVDEVIRQGSIDPKKLGVTGGSGGGLLTDWTVTHTNRFAAAVSQRDIADWASWWYEADMPLFVPGWFKGAPFDVPEEFRSRSPITYVKNIQTPMMFILGDADSRTPTGAGGEEIFRALKTRGIATVMVRFPRETHELSRSGEPKHRVERLDHITGWFDKYLQGQSKPEYDVVTPKERALDTAVQ